jgi:hypothetical protein
MSETAAAMSNEAKNQLMRRIIDLGAGFPATDFIETLMYAQFYGIALQWPDHSDAYRMIEALCGDLKSGIADPEKWRAYVEASRATNDDER